MEENKNENVDQEPNTTTEQTNQAEQDNTSTQTSQTEENKEQTKSDGELKKEAAETFKQTKEQIKNMNIKEEAQKGKGLLGKLFKEPIETIKEIVDDDKNQFYKTAIFIVGVWVAIILIRQILNVLMYEYYTFSLLGTIKSVISPILKVLVMAIIIHLLNKENKQPLTKSITAVAVAKIPLVISTFLGLLTFISSRMTLIINPISSLLSVISTILMYFVIKEMFKEKEDSIKAFIKVEAIYYIVAFVFSFLGISL